MTTIRAALIDVSILIGLTQLLFAVLSRDFGVTGEKVKVGGDYNAQVNAKTLKSESVAGAFSP